ncbi:hypothetical protein PS2_000412 [Malus domestica]
MTVVLEESDGSDEIPLPSHLQPRDLPPSALEAIVRVSPFTADRGKRLAVEPKAMAETPIHPLDQDLNIPPQ